MYLTYADYIEYGGTLSESAFNSLAFDAQVKIDYYTFNRLVNDTVFSEKVKKCMYKIINSLDTLNKYLASVNDMTNPILSSQSNDGVSVSYGGLAGNTSPSDVKNVEAQTETDIIRTIKEYLQGEKNQAGEVLLYRGVY